MKTFKDQETGLEWLLEDFGPMTWEEAMALDVDGFKLPTSDQLLALMRNSTANLSCSNPIDTASKIYWASRSYKLGSANAWNTYFDKGKGDKHFYVRLVRPISVQNGMKAPEVPHAAAQKDEAIFRDDANNLEWLLKIYGTCSFEKACNYATETGFRIPTKREIETLIDFNTVEPACRLEIPLLRGKYWTCTPLAESKSCNWVVNFRNGETDTSQLRFNNYLILTRSIRVVAEGIQ